MDFGEHNVGALRIMLEPGNNGVGFRNSDICIYCECGLGIRGQQSPYGNDRTYVEVSNHPFELRPPRRNLVFIAFRKEMSRKHISFAVLDDLPLDLRHSPEIRLNMLPTSCSKRVTHLANSLIASQTDL